MSWDAWYLEFEELNGELKRPVYIKASDLKVLEECWERGLTAEEALEDAITWINILDD
jgi:hypothetical protein